MAWKESSAMFLVFMFYAQLRGSLQNDITLPSSCPNLTFGSIPADHLFSKKKKPVIIAHRGQPKVYQENTYDGILSAVDIKADGFELDIYKTKDNKLVVFHDDNTIRMTGVSKTVWESTYEELRQLNITNNITAGGKTYLYDKTRKIPLLEEVLNATKETDLVHYLEMKPSLPSSPGNNGLAQSTGELVADMVTKLGLIKKSIVVSFDYHKVYAVKSRNPDIVVGTLVSTSFSRYPKVTAAATWFRNLSQCANDGPNGTLDFFKFALNYGLLFKYSGSSSFDCGIDLYDNPKYSNNTLATLRRNYRSDISTGFYTVYSMSKIEEQNKKDEIKLKNLLGQGGGERLITDDVPRLRKLLGRDDAPDSAGIIKKTNAYFLITVSVIAMTF